MRIYFSHPHPRRKKDCIPSTILQKQLLIHTNKEENIIYCSLPMRVRKKKGLPFLQAQPNLIGAKESTLLSHKRRLYTILILEANP